MTNLHHFPLFIATSFNFCLSTAFYICAFIYFSVHRLCVTNTSPANDSSKGGRPGGQHGVSGTEKSVSVVYVFVGPDIHPQNIRASWKGLFVLLTRGEKRMLGAVQLGHGGSFFGGNLVY